MACENCRYDEDYDPETHDVEMSWQNNVCDKCGHELPSPLDRIPIVLEKLKKEMGYGEKCKSKQSKG